MSGHTLHGQEPLQYFLHFSIDYSVSVDCWVSLLLKCPSFLAFILMIGCIIHLLLVLARFEWCCIVWCVFQRCCAKGDQPLLMSCLKAIVWWVTITFICSRTFNISLDLATHVFSSSSPQSSYSPVASANINSLRLDRSKAVHCCIEASIYIIQVDLLWNS